MKILQLTSNIFNQSKQNINQTQFLTIHTLRPLKQDTVSFGAMRKSQFEGIDYAVVEKFKAPIEKFNSNDDLQDWAAIKVKEIVSKDFGGRQEETRIQRKSLLSEWSDYVIKENVAYNNAIALLVLNSITKDLNPYNDKLPPVLNKGVLADCISEIDKNLRLNKRYQFDFKKMYNEKLSTFYIEDTEIKSGKTCWVKIPSKDNDPENFDANVEKLKTLSHKNWCTKSFNAEPYLEEGDFHVYLENGQPKLGIRFIGDEVEEIQGELNDGRIPFPYLNGVKDYIAKNNFKLSRDIRSEIITTQEIIDEVARIKMELKDFVANNDAKKIFEYFEIDVEEDEDGLLVIDAYGQPSDVFTFADCGVDENNLFKNVKKIRKKANFINSQITDLGNLELIEGDVWFRDSKVTSLGNLRSIGGFAGFNNSRLTDLGKLEFIGGDARFENSLLTTLGNLKSIGGYAEFNDSKVSDLGKLKNIGGYALFINSNVTSLGKLETIGGNAYFYCSKLSDLGNLVSVGGEATFNNSLIKNLGNLRTIGGIAYFSHSQVESLGGLKLIGGDAYFNDSQVTDLGKLQYIGRVTFVRNSKLTMDDFRNVKFGLALPNFDL